MAGLIQQRRKTNVARPVAGGCLAMLIAVAHFAGCSTGDSTTPSSEAGVAESEVQRGPLTVHVHVTPEPARLSDEATLTLTFEYEAGIELEKPPFGDMLGDFLILDFHEPLAEIKDEREIVRQVYSLEPTRSGSLQIDPLVIYFTDARPQGDGQRHHLETEAVTVEVLSVVDADVPSLDDLQDYESPGELPVSRRYMAVVVLMSAAGVVVVGLVGWLLWRRRRETEARKLTPRELALAELQELASGDLNRTDVKAYYVRLSSIVRTFIERTSGVRAPEQTTEEFLQEISKSGDQFDRVERQRLRDFLEAADLVKFAAFRPKQDDIQVAFSRAELFIGVDQVEEEA